MIWKKLDANPLVLAANFGFVSEAIVIKKDQAEETTKKSNQSESTSEETSDTTGLTKTATAFDTTSVSDGESAGQGDSKQDGSKIWLTILITGTVLLAAFGLSGVILKKLHNR